MQSSGSPPHNSTATPGGEFDWRSEQSSDFLRVFFFRALVFGLCSYGMLYYAYKYYQPQFGGDDYFRYLPMYANPFDHQVPDPYRTRRLSVLFTHAIAEIGIYYPNNIAFEQPRTEQKLFFAALLSNAVALWGTALVCAYSTRERGAVPILAGALVFLGFGAQLFVLTGLTEGVSWFLIALGFAFFRRGKWAALWAVLFLSAWQRETIPVVFGCFAAASLFRGQSSERRAHQITLLVAVAAFGFYLWLRTLDPARGRGTGQLGALRMAGNLRDFSPGVAWLFQVGLSQNLLFLWGLTMLLLRRAAQSASSTIFYAPQIWLSVAALTLGGIATGIGNNTGRILAILTPILAPLIAPAIARLKL